VPNRDEVRACYLTNEVSADGLSQLSVIEIRLVFKPADTGYLCDVKRVFLADQPARLERLRKKLAARERKMKKMQLEYEKMKESNPGAAERLEVDWGGPPVYSR